MTGDRTGIGARTRNKNARVASAFGVRAARNPRGALVGPDAVDFHALVLLVANAVLAFNAIAAPKHLVALIATRTRHVDARAILLADRMRYACNRRRRPAGDPVHAFVGPVVRPHDATSSGALRVIGARNTVGTIVGTRPGHKHALRRRGTLRVLYRTAAKSRVTPVWSCAGNDGAGNAAAFSMRSTGNQRRTCVRAGARDFHAKRMHAFVMRDVDAVSAAQEPVARIRAGSGDRHARALCGADGMRDPRGCGGTREGAHARVRGTRTAAAAGACYARLARTAIIGLLSRHHDANTVCALRMESAGDTLAAFVRAAAVHAHTAIIVRTHRVRGAASSEDGVASVPSGASHHRAERSSALRVIAAGDGVAAFVGPVARHVHAEVTGDADRAFPHAVPTTECFGAFVPPLPGHIDARAFRAHRMCRRRGGPSGLRGTAARWAGTAVPGHAGIGPVSRHHYARFS